MKLLATICVTAILTTGSALAASAAPAAAEDMARGISTCNQLWTQYPDGIAKSKKAANRAVRQGYRKPFVCKRVYLQLKRLDNNRNKSICENR